MGRDKTSPKRIRTSGARLLLVALLVAGTVSSAAAADGFRRVGTIPTVAGGRLVADGGARHLIEVSGTSPLELTLYDADRLTRLRTVPFPTISLPKARNARFDIDEAGRRLYVIGLPSLPGGLSAASANPADLRLFAIDLDSFDVVGNVALAGSVPPGLTVQGVTLDGDTLLAVAGPSEAAANTGLSLRTELVGVVVVGVDPSTGAPTWGPVPVRGCRRLMDGQAAIGRIGDRIFIACATGAAANTPLPGTAAVVEVPGGGNPSDQRSYFVPGVYSPVGERTFYDATGKRLVIVGSSGAWVFDVVRRRFVGQFPTSEGVVAAGMDLANGRVYFATLTRLLVSGVRGAELSQPIELQVPTGVGWITPVPFAGTVVVPSEGEFPVYRNGLPDELFGAAGLVDYRLLDRARSEFPQFATDAQAFGLRIHVVGGLTSARRNVAPDLGGAETLLLQPLEELGLKDGERDFYVARVATAHLGDADAAASAISQQADEATASNLGVVTGDDDMPFEPASCADLGDGAPPDEEEGASAECSLERGTVTATASGEVQGSSGVISFGKATSSSTLVHSAKSGLTGEARAEAYDIHLGDTVYLGHVTSRIEVQSFGRKGTAHAKYVRSFENVRAGDFSCTTDCDVKEVLANLTASLGAQFRVEMPEEEVVKTPGGAHAHAFRKHAAHQEDIVLNNQDPVEFQVPALRVTFVNDGKQASRAIVDFAATGGTSTYLPIGAGPGEFEIPDLNGFLGGTIGVPVGGSGGGLTLIPERGEPPLPRVVRVLGHGWKLLVGKGGFLQTAALWALFMTPMFFGERRRHLRRLAGLGR